MLVVRGERAIPRRGSLVNSSEAPIGALRRASGNGLLSACYRAFVRHIAPATARREPTSGRSCPITVATSRLLCKGGEVPDSGRGQRSGPVPRTLVQVLEVLARLAGPIGPPPPTSGADHSPGHGGASAARGAQRVAPLEARSGFSRAVVNVRETLNECHLLRHGPFGVAGRCGPQLG